MFILDVVGGIFRSGVLLIFYVVEKIVIVGMYIVVVVIINLNFCGNERIVDVVFILYFVVRRVVNNFDGYIDVLGIFGFLDYINFVRYFSVISRFVVEEYIIGRFGCIEIIIG